MAKHASILRKILFLVTLVFAVRLLGLGFYPLMDTSEARYGEMARKMVELNQWIVPMYTYDQPFLGKPPLSFWGFAMGIELFGVNSFAIRFSSWLYGLGTAILMFLTVTNRPGRHARDLLTAALSVLIYASCLIGYKATGAVLTDSSLMFSITLAITGFYNGYFNKQSMWLFCGFVGLGLGLLAKGPISTVLIGTIVILWLVWQKESVRFFSSPPIYAGLVLAAAIALPWYLIAEKQSPGFIEYFIIGEHWQRFVVPGWHGDLYGQGHAEPQGTIWLFALEGLMPWTLILPVLFFSNSLFRYNMKPTLSRALRDPWIRLLLCWFVMPMIVFTLARNITSAYVLACLPAIAMLLAYPLTEYLILNKDKKFTLTTVFVAACFIPFAKFTANVQGDSWYNQSRNQRPIVQYYQQLNLSQSAPLFFASDRRRFSAEFYNAGQIQYIKSTEIPNTNERMYIALINTMDSQLKQIVEQRCEEKHNINQYQLFFCAKASIIITGKDEEMTKDAHRT